MIKIRSNPENIWVFNTWLTIKDKSQNVSLMYKKAKKGNELYLVSDEHITPSHTPISLNEICWVR